MHSSSSSRAQVGTGRLLMWLGLLGWFLLLIAAADGLPAGWRAGIVSNSAVWAVCSGGLLVVGVRVLWMGSHRRTSWRPELPGKRFQTIIVYSRRECSLCEEAMELLAQYRSWLPVPLEVDIDEVSEFRSKYNESVPVVEIDGRIRFRGCINEVLLQRLIEGTPPLPDLRHR